MRSGVNYDRGASLVLKEKKRGEISKRLCTGFWAKYPEKPFVLDFLFFRHQVGTERYPTKWRRKNQRRTKVHKKKYERMLLQGKGTFTDIARSGLFRGAGNNLAQLTLFLSLLSVYAVKKVWLF